MKETKVATREDMREVRHNGMADARADLYFWLQRKKGQPWTGPKSMTAEEGYDAAIEEMEAYLEQQA